MQLLSRKETEAAVSEEANPSSDPALTELNIFNTNFDSIYVCVYCISVCISNEFT